MYTGLPIGFLATQKTRRTSLSETFVRAWINFNAIRTETLKAYLFTIARNIYLESLRKHRDHVELNDAHADPHPRSEKITRTPKTNWTRSAISF